LEKDLSAELTGLFVVQNLLIDDSKTPELPFKTAPGFIELRIIKDYKIRTYRIKNYSPRK